MSGRGERPAEGDQEQQAEERAESVSVGQGMYNMDGELIGHVRGYEEGGFFVTTREGIEGLSIDHARSGHDFGQAHLMWRCMSCGEMGKLAGGMPEQCSNCGTGKEGLMWWTED